MTRNQSRLLSALAQQAARGRRGATPSPAVLLERVQVELSTRLRRALSEDEGRSYTEILGFVGENPDAVVAFARKGVAA